MLLVRLASQPTIIAQYCGATAASSPRAPGGLFEGGLPLFTSLREGVFSDAQGLRYTHKCSRHLPKAGLAPMMRDLKTLVPFSKNLWGEIGGEREREESGTRLFLAPIMNTFCQTRMNSL